MGMSWCSGWESNPYIRFSKPTSYLWTTTRETQPSNPFSRNAPGRSEQEAEAPPEHCVSRCLLQKNVGGNRTRRASRFADGRLSNSDDVKKRLTQESNLVYNLRKVACESGTLASPKRRNVECRIEHPKTIRRGISDIGHLSFDISQVADAGVEPAARSL